MPRTRTLLAAAAVLFGRAALAQDGADAARRALIIDARAASRAGDHARAVDLATRAEAIHATPSLRHFLAREHLSLGHAVEALSLAGECAARARDDATVPDRELLLARCEAVAREAERGVARLTVRVPSPVPEGLRVTLAGDPLAPSLFDVAVPRAPGAVEVAATAPGRSPFRATPELAAGASGEVVVELPALPTPPVIAPPPVTAPAPPPVAPAPAPVVRRPAPRSPGAGPWIVGSLGVAGLITAGALGALVLDAGAQRDAACPSRNDCDPDAAAAHDGRMRDLAVGVNVAVAVGGALVAGAVTWLIAARVARRPAVSVAYAPGGVALRW